LVRPPKEVVSIVTALIDSGNTDLADDLLDH
jgi:hypothetical protein